MGIATVGLDKSIAQVIENYKAAIFAKNVEKLMPIYDQNVRVFDACRM
jgi:ketosteroid isomerase-like protein